MNVISLVTIDYYETVCNQSEHNNLVGDGCGEDGERKMAEVLDILVPLVTVVALAITLLITLAIISKTRRTIRNNSNIPRVFCKDFSLSTFCAVRVLAQMDSHVSDQIETTRSESWKQQELELQNMRKEEDTNFEPENTCERGRIGLNVCKWMVFLFVATLISLAVIGLDGEDELYFTYSIKILGVLQFCLVHQEMSQRKTHLDHHELELELDNDVSESFQNDVGNMCENEIV